MTLHLNAETIANLDAIRRASGEATNTEVVRQALRYHRESLARTAAVSEVATESLEGATPSPLLLARNRKEIIRYAGVLIEALQEALDYDPIKNHNQQIPPLFVDDPKYLSDIAALTKELKKLNKLLASTTAGAAKIKSAKDASKYIQLFMSQYVPTLGKGTAYLTIGVMGALLGSMGVDSNIVHQVLAELRSLKP